MAEHELVGPALRHLAATPNGYLSTSDLIAALEAEFAPSGEDAEILEGRSDTKFSQKVRNLVSHRNGGGGLTCHGYATYSRSRRGFTITDSGRERAARSP